MHTNQTTSTRHVMIPILDLACGGALGLEHAIEKVPGVLNVYVNPATETAYIECDPMRYDPVKISAVIEETGFRAGPVLTQ
jgi:copper chaperone CopZ